MNQKISNDVLDNYNTFILEFYVHFLQCSQLILSREVTSVRRCDLYVFHSFRPLVDRGSFALRRELSGANIREPTLYNIFMTCLKTDGGKRKLFI
jgi:hypothetical protein